MQAARRPVLYAGNIFAEPQVGSETAAVLASGGRALFFRFQEVGSSAASIFFPGHRGQEAEIVNVIYVG